MRAGVSETVAMRLTGHKTESTPPARLGPVGHAKLFEPGEILDVERDQHESIGVSDRCDQSIGKRHWCAKAFETGTLVSMPRRSSLIVRKDRKRGLHDIMKIVFDGIAAFSSGEPPAAVYELVPHRRRNGAFMSVLVEPPEDVSIGGLGGWRGDDARVEQVPKRHKETFRPVPLSRMDAAKSSSRPISSSEYVSGRRCEANILLYMLPAIL